jgi:hypothetical protein
MFMTFRRSFLGGLVFAAAVAAVAAQTPIMPIGDVKAGQKGVGRTVFEESKVEDFDVDILGVLNNVQPKRDIIIARLHGKNLENTGVIAGMSGSPVYIDGKLIGAVAFSYAYAKEAIAGITPIGEMLELRTRPSSPSSPSSGAMMTMMTEIPFKPALSLNELFEMRRDVLMSPEALSVSGQALSPLPVPLVFGGFSSRLIDAVTPLFSRLGFRPVKSGLWTGDRPQISDKPPAPEPPLRAGDPVTLQLVSGDLDLSAVGTVTYVDGKTVLAFGHPVYNLGAVDYAMAKARIVTVVPMLDSSFKISETGATIGAFTQDRIVGAVGEIGRTPRLIPLNIRLVGEGTRAEELKLKIVNDRILTPILANMSTAALLTNEARAVGDVTLEMTADVFLDNGLSVHLEDLFSGNFDAPLQDLVNLVTAVVFYLTNNEFKDVGLYRIDLGVKTTEQVKLASLERVWLDKYEVAPGEPVAVKVYYRGFRGERLVEDVGFAAPNLPAGSEFQLIVGDAASMQKVEAGQYRSTGLVPRNLSQLVRLLNSLRKNNRIYFKLIASQPGLFLRGEEMPNLPPAMKSLFASPRASSPAPTELSNSTLGEYQLPVPYVFRGLAVIPVKIRR